MHPGVTSGNDNTATEDGGSSSAAGCRRRLPRLGHLPNGVRSAQAPRKIQSLPVSQAPHLAALRGWRGGGWGVVLDLSKQPFSPKWDAPVLASFARTGNHCVGNASLPHVPPVFVPLTFRTPQMHTHTPPPHILPSLYNHHLYDPEIKISRRLTSRRRRNQPRARSAELLSTPTAEWGRCTWRRRRAAPRAEPPRLPSPPRNSRTRARRRSTPAKPARFIPAPSA